jgi:mobilization protein NikA
MSANDNSQPPRYKRSGSNKRQRNTGAVLVRLLPDERAAVEEKAREVGLSLASFLRACGLGTPGPRAKRSAPVNAEALARATAALNKVGSNLNQIAHGLNATGGFSLTAQECFAALAETRAAAAAIREIVRRKDNDLQRHNA